MPLWNGAQLAVDTTSVSPLTRDAVPRCRRDLARPVASLDARRQRERTYPELLRSSRCRLSVLGVEVGGRWSTAMQAFAASLSALPSAGLFCLDGPAPALNDVLAGRTGPVPEVLARRLSAHS